MRLMQILLCLSLFIALYHVALIMLRIPSRASAKAFDQGIVQKERWRDRLNNTLVLPLIEPVAAIVPMSLERETELRAELRQVGMFIQPREYYARAAILAVYSLSLNLIVPLLGISPAFYLAMIALSLLTFRNFTTEHTDRLKEKRKRMQIALPSFIRSILYSLEEHKERTDRFVVQVNLIRIFGNYLTVAPDVMQYDVSLLITDMKTMGTETGLRRFAERIRLPVVSYLCDILIGLTRGQPQAEALAILARDVDVSSRELRRNELNKRPEEMSMNVVPLILITMVTVLVVIISDMWNSLGVFM